MTIIENLKKLYSSLVRKERPVREDVASVFRFKYSLFKELLAANTELLNIITDIEEKLQGRQLFGMSYIRSQTTRGVFYSFRMVKSLNVLSGNRYPELYKVLEKIHNQIREIVGQKKEHDAPALILPFADITKEMTDWVGGKSANLGEVQNRAHLPVPHGFAITTSAFDLFLSRNDLVNEINKRKMNIDVNEPESIEGASKEVQRLILAAPVPEELQQAINGAYDTLARQVVPAAHQSQGLTVSLRSSAIGEDSGDTSFAGQYLTVLNVAPEDLSQTYKQVIASLYSPRAIAYRLNKGIRDEDIAMSVVGLEMVPSVASGVVYTRNPLNVLDDNVLVSAVWGLGPYAVDGVISPDSYRVAKDTALTIQEIRTAHKPSRLVNVPGGGVTDQPVPEDQQDKPCLSPEQIQTLAGYALRLEEHYKGPQDIEWALDPQGRLLILQTRPLHLQVSEVCDVKIDVDMCVHPLLVERGAVAYPGIGCGPAFILKSESDLGHFPEGAVLVAKHSSPKFALVMRRAQAIVTDSGSVSGHMAAVVREFGVPTILDTKSATIGIPEGVDITVDAYHGKVYLGRVQKLLAIQQTRQSHMQDTPVYQTLRQVADFIVPLHLIDPKSHDFDPDHCESLHDIGRLVHEFSYQTMFQVSDLVTDEQGGAVKLDAPIPLDLYIIDLGGGLQPGSFNRVRVDQIKSLPFKTLLVGMLHDELRVYGPRPVQFTGFFSVMREQMLSAPGERFGDRSYAVISDKYLNFSSRVGYHYSILDAYCGETVNKNYITFSFKGGAADEVRKNRRVRAIAAVLEAQEFQVDVTGDRVYARFQKYPREVIETKLEMVGRLLQFTRQMDMLMNSEASVEMVAKNFLSGNYHYDENFLELSEREEIEKKHIPSL
jgi:pyruvate, water dikinase